MNGKEVLKKELKRLLAEKGWKFVPKELKDGKNPPEQPASITFTKDDKDYSFRSWQEVATFARKQ